MITKTKTGSSLVKGHRTASLAMGLAAAAVTLVSAGCPAVGYAAEAAPAQVTMAKTVSLTVKDQPLKSVLAMLEKQTGYLFVINGNVDTSAKVSVDAKNRPVAEVLDKLLAGQGINYAIDGHNIVLSRNSLSGNAEGQAAADNAKGTVTTITGTVNDPDGEPCIGASVRVKGSPAAVATDIDGHFVLKGHFKPNQLLEVSYIGLKTKSVKVGNGRDLNIDMEGDVNMLQEVVAVGYGTQKRVNLTGAVSSVDVNKQLDSRPITQVTNALQGAVPGLTVHASNGRPGSTSTMKIREGIGSINGDTNPLILVDNVEVNDLSLINPDDIESISVLKDAASASIYGVRGAFGVVLITTKQAELGEKFTVSYSDNFSWKKPTVVPELATGSEGATLALLGVERSKGVHSVTTDNNMYWDWNTVERMKEWERVYGGYNLSPEMVEGRDFEKLNGYIQFYRSWDPYEAMMKKSSFMQTHNFAINGSSGKTSYNVNLGYMGNTGMIKVNNDEQKRYNVSFGTRSQLKDWFEFHTKLMYTRTDTENPFKFGSSTYDEFYYLYRWPATYPYGTYNGKPVRNSVTEREQANRNKIRNNWMRISLGFTANLYKGLTLETDYTYTHVGRYTETNGGKVEGYNFWNNSWEYGSWTAATDNFSSKLSDFSDYHVLNALLRYK